MQAKKERAAEDGGRVQIMQNPKLSKTELFEQVSIPRALTVLAVPTIISQLINLIYNMADAFFIGRTGNAYMMAATTVTLTLTMLNVAFSNLFGVGGGSQIARLMGQKRDGEGKAVSAYAVRSAVTLALGYSLVTGLFLDPILRFLGASDDTVGFARQYALIVIVIGSTPTILSQTLAHLLRNTGYSGQASFGLSMGGVINIALDPLFMFVILPPGNEVLGAAVATLISNVIACVYLLTAFRSAARRAPLTLRLREARGLDRENLRAIYTVGVPSAILTGLFDVASVFTNKLAAAHDDLVLAAFGIVMKVERIPNAVNIGICQGMMPIVAYNYAAGNRARMHDAVRTARTYGLIISAVSILLLEIFARPVTNLFLSTSRQDVLGAATTVALAAAFLRVRCLAAPVQLVNYHSSFSLQAVGRGGYTMLHACVRELGVYIPLMFLLDAVFGQTGLAAALPAGEAMSAVFALWLLYKALGSRK